MLNWFLKPFLAVHLGCIIQARRNICNLRTCWNLCVRLTYQASSLCASLELWFSALAAQESHVGNSEIVPMASYSQNNYIRTSGGGSQTGGHFLKLPWQLQYAVKVEKYCIRGGTVRSMDLRLRSWEGWKSSQLCWLVESIPDFQGNYLMSTENWFQFSS